MPEQSLPAVIMAPHDREVCRLWGERLIEMGREEEREACAKVAESCKDLHYGVACEIANRIRAR